MLDQYDQRCGGEGLHWFVITDVLFILDTVFLRVKYFDF